MHAIILWVLIQTGPHPYPVETFPTHGECIQAKYDYSQSSGSHASRNSMICRPRFIKQ